MGGRGRSRTQRKHFRQGRENVWKRSKSDSQQQQQEDDNSRGPNWQPFATQNPSFDEYYREQGVVPPEEWDVFIEYLRKPLPAAFRINSSTQCYKEIRSKLENDFMMTLQSESIDASEKDAIRPLPWYPDNLAWHSNFSRNQLRKNQTLERFHEFLKLQNEIGNITRQEAVSMVPPLFLDVQPDHFVLDMCAAPGSKTFQLLEMIHQSNEPGSLPTGRVVANDVDVQRCNLLIHQTKRMCTANLIVTNHEAQHFPSCHLNKRVNASEPGTLRKLDLTELQFDRVLCDVPCSGDGTLRKAPDIWRKWNVGMGNGVHGLQVLIAMRGLSLLKVGGQMVYSTCSMNPVENEAVVSEILQRCGDSVELIDVSSELPQLLRRPGLKKWKVRDRGMWFASHKDVPASRRAAVSPGMFPSGKAHMETSELDHDAAMIQLCGNRNSENGLHSDMDPSLPVNTLDEEASMLPLERCMRIVPHDQNTGAFFIAVFHKLSPLPVIQKKSVNSREQLSSSKGLKEGTDEGKVNAAELDHPLPAVKGTDTDVADSKDGQDIEATSDADILDVETNEEALDTDSGEVSEKIDLVEVQSSIDVGAGPEIVRGKRKLQIQGKWRGVDPVIFYNDDATVARIKDFYGIKESFPFNGHLVTRNSETDHVKRIYYISKSVKNVLQLNLLAGQPLKIASIGLKMFERQSSKEGSTAPCIFRISSEGLPLLLPHISKQILYASPVDFKHLLQYKSIKFSDFVDAGFGEKASKLMLGCCVVMLNKDENEMTSSSPHVDASTIAIGCWRGRTNVSVMVTALDCQELLERVSPDAEIMPPEHRLSTAETGDKGVRDSAEVKENSADTEL